MPVICKSCAQYLSSSKEGVHCVKCSQVYHPACVNMTSTDVAHLTEKNQPWMCGGCSSGIGRSLRSNSTSSSSAKGREHTKMSTDEQFSLIMSSIRGIEATLQTITKVQEDIRSELARVNKTVNNHSKTLSEHSVSIEHCQSTLEEHNSSIAVCQAAVADLTASYNKVSLEVDSVRSNVTSAPCSTSTSSEAVEILKRSHNVIFRKLPEAPNDEDQVRELLNVIDQSCYRSIVSISRLTSSKSSAAQPRPVKVVFNNIFTPKNILRNKSALLTSTFKDVTVTDDKTPAEMRSLMALREQLKARQAAGEQNITIKYVKGTPSIVHISPKK